MWPVKKQYFMYVADPEIELSDSVSLSLSVTAPTHPLSPSVVRGTTYYNLLQLSTSNCDFTLQYIHVKHSCQSLVNSNLMAIALLSVLVS